MPFRRLDQLRQAPAAGGVPGTWAACTAHPLALEAALHQGRRDGSAVLVEATASQVNLEGGYTGMTPGDFGGLVARMARQAGLPPGRLILGADHLGPYPWRRLPAPQALEKAAALVRACVRAGFRKLHLDAAVVCAGDPTDSDGALPPELAVGRTVHLCRAAAAAWAEMGARELPWLVVGTDTPVPGGGRSPREAPPVTSPESLERTIGETRAAFAAAGLEAFWQRVLAVVVQPGLEFYPEEIRDYDPQRCRGLREVLAAHPHLVFEAHSTDFQQPEGLRRLVTDRFAILKVGPRLTFALREAVEALARVEAILARRHRGLAPSGVMEALEAAMLARPEHWREHYRGSPADLAYLRRYGLSDRIRYYWSGPEVVRRLERLQANLEAMPPPLSLVSQFLPRQAEALREGRLANRPRDLIRHKIMEVTAVYARVCDPAAAGREPGG